MANSDSIAGEGMYYVIAEVEEFEPVEQKIALGRGSNVRT